MTGAGAAQAAEGGRRPVAMIPFAQVASPRAAAPIRIVTQYRFEASEMERIRSAAQPTAVDIAICSTQEEMREKLRDAEVFYGSLSGADLDYAPKLKWIQAGGAGVEGMDPRVRQSPVVMTNYARTFAPAISETAMGLLLCLTRGISKYYMPQFSKRRMEPVGTPKSDHHTELPGQIGRAHV